MRTRLVSGGPAAFVIMSFLLSRLLYLRAGLRFDLTPPRYYYQFIDPELLRGRLFESLWYLHSQPPLLNFATGILYQFFSPQSKVFQAIFFALGLGLGSMLYGLGLRLGLKPWVSALIAAWFMVSPATVLYENLYFYTYPVAFLLVLSALALHRFLETDSSWWGFGFFSLIAALCLTWALFHLFWMIAVIVLVGAFYRDWRRLALVSLLPVLAVSGWYAKNYFQFGSFSASSWAGMNLSHVTFLSPLTAPSVREELIGRGELAPYPVVEAFRSIRDYQGFMAVPPRRGIPVLDEPLKSTGAVNFNHVFYIELSDRMTGDALRFIRSRPGDYFSSVRQGLSIYFHSSSDYLLLKDRPAPQLEAWWDRIFYGQPSRYDGDFGNRWKASPAFVGWWLVLAYAAAVLYGWKVFTARGTTDHRHAGVVTWMAFTILYFTVMANFLDLGENNRFRFALDPLVLVLFGRLVQDLLARLRRRT